MHADHLNRPVAMSNAAKSWVWRATWSSPGFAARNRFPLSLQSLCREPFGAVHAITGPAANDNRFPGQMFQLEAGLSYNWHRHYDATLGRYTQADPLGLQTLLSDGPSVYGYAGQKPLELTDPTGEMGRGGGGAFRGLGERGFTRNPGGTGNPNKHWKPDPNRPGWGTEKNPHTGDKIYKREPPWVKKVPPQAMLDVQDKCSI